jgi:hypothetical protein
MNGRIRACSPKGNGFLYFVPHDLRLRPDTSRFTIKDIGFGLRKNWNKDDLENRT